MERQELIDLVLANTDGYECYPFNGPNSHEKSNGRSSNINRIIKSWR